MKSETGLASANSERPVGLSRQSLRFFRRIPGNIPGILTVAAGLSVLATPAQAYIDPGVGGMLLQLLLGGMAGAAVILRLYWQRVSDTYHRLIGRSDKVEQSIDSDQDAGE
jgi:hypothetical protein